MKEIQFDDWKHFKDVCIKRKKLNIQCIDYISDNSFQVFAVEGHIYWFINLIVDEDIRDFKKNFLKNINKRI